MTYRCGKGSPCIYQCKFKISWAKFTVYTCGQHLNYFLDRILKTTDVNVVKVELA